jgi:hypothetical protein
MIATPIKKPAPASRWEGRLNGRMNKQITPTIRTNKKRISTMSTSTTSLGEGAA